MDALQRLVQRRRGRERRPWTTSRRRADTGPQLLRVAGQAPEGHRLPFEQRDQPTADVAAAARQQGRRAARLVRDRHRFWSPWPVRCGQYDRRVPIMACGPRHRIGDDRPGDADDVAAKAVRRNDRGVPGGAGEARLHLRGGRGDGEPCPRRATSWTTPASSWARARRSSGRPGPPCGAGSSSAWAGSRRGRRRRRSRPARSWRCMARAPRPVVAQRLPDRLRRGRGGAGHEVRLRLRDAAGPRREWARSGSWSSGTGASGERVVRHPGLLPPARLPDPAGLPVPATGPEAIREGVGGGDGEGREARGRMKVPVAPASSPGIPGRSGARPRRGAKKGVLNGMSIEGGIRRSGRTSTMGEASTLVPPLVEAPAPLVGDADAATARAAHRAGSCGSRRSTRGSPPGGAGCPRSPPGRGTRRPTRRPPPGHAPGPRSRPRRAGPRGSAPAARSRRRTSRCRRRGSGRPRPAAGPPGGGRAGWTARIMCLVERKTT